MNPTLIVNIPECDHCGREKDFGGRFVIEDDIKPVLVDAGLYAGHPASGYGQMTPKELAAALTKVRTKLLKEAYGYMGMIQRINRHTGRYEDLILNLTRFIDSCLKYPTATIEID